MLLFTTGLGWVYLLFAIELYVSAHLIKEKINGRQDASVIKRYKRLIFWYIAVALFLAMVWCVAA